MFRYIENEKQTYGYFQAKAYVSQRFYSYTVKEQYLLQLDGVDVGILRDDPENWSRSVGGDKPKSTQPTVSSIIDGVTTYQKPVTHTDIYSAHCVSSSIAGAMFEIGFPFQTQAI